MSVYINRSYQIPKIGTDKNNILYLYCYITFINLRFSLLLSRSCKSVKLSQNLINLKNLNKTAAKTWLMFLQILSFTQIFFKKLKHISKLLQQRDIFRLCMYQIQLLIYWFKQEGEELTQNLLLLHRPGVSKLSPMGQNQAIICFVNRVLFKCSHAYSFTYCLQLFLCCKGRVEQL